MQNYYANTVKESKPVRLSPSHEDLKALIAQAHRSVYRSESVPVITDLIDNIMSIPSCLQDAKSKVTLVREWIKQNPKSPEKTGTKTPTDCDFDSSPVKEKPKEEEGTEEKPKPVQNNEPYASEIENSDHKEIIRPVARMFRNKTPYSSLPPPPSRKKTNIKAHNGNECDKLLSSVSDDSPSTEDDLSQGVSMCQPLQSNKK